MKSEHFLLTGGAVLLVWSMRSEAHSSFEAMQQGGSLLHMTIEFLHPLFEQPWWMVAIMAALWTGHIAWRMLKRWLTVIPVTMD